MFDAETFALALSIIGSATVVSFLVGLGCAWYEGWLERQDREARED